MSFSKLKVDELRLVAQSFGVELPPKANKEVTIATLLEEGVTYETYQSFLNAEKEEPLESAVDVFQQEFPDNTETILVKMDRPNPYYQIGVYTFTSDHPFLNMVVDDAQKIFDSEEGFRVATPAEVKGFYS